MLLNGDLNVFRIHEVLWFLSYFKKSGILSCESQDERAEFAIYDGQLARVIYPEENFKFGQLLLKWGLIDSKKLEEALDFQKKFRKQLGETLIELRVITRNDLNSLLSLQIEEIMFRVLSWKYATFEFNPIEVKDLPENIVYPSEKQNFIAFLGQFLVKAREYLKCLDQLPPENVLLKSNLELFKTESGIKDNAKAKELVKMADSSKTLKEIKNSSSFGTLDTAKMLVDLYQKNIIIKAKS